MVAKKEQYLFRFASQSNKWIGEDIPVIDCITWTYFETPGEELV